MTDSGDDDVYTQMNSIRLENVGNSSTTNLQEKDKMTIIKKGEGVINITGVH